MSLEMKIKCEKCSRELKQDSDACICSYECTFCPDCTREMNNICPNCNGVLVSRPKRNDK